MKKSFETPEWLDTSEYPFKSKFVDLDGDNTMHYIDEGSGEVLLFVHGTPTWSFDYRNLIKSLSTNYRCIAIDHIGFGLSDKPADYQYTVENHCANLSKFIDLLNLKQINIIVHDFGGPIGLGYAVDHPENINKIIAFNTWIWSSEGEPEYEKMKSFLKSPLLPFLYKWMNFSPKVLLPSMYAKQEKLSNKIKAHYVKPFSSSKERNGALGFAKSLLSEQKYFESIWNKKNSICNKNTLFIWGLKDKVFPEYYLKKFQQSFSKSKSTIFPECGHFPHETEPKAVLNSIKEFLNN